MKRIIIYTAAIASMALALASCEKEPSTGGKKGVLSLRVVSDGIQTKSSIASPEVKYGETIDLSTDEFDLFITSEETVNTSNILLDEPLTKADIISTGNFEEKRGTDFNVRLTNAGTTTEYETDVKPVSNNGLWEIKKGEDYVMWPENDAAIDFWCWSGSNFSDLTVVPAEGDFPTGLTFNYKDNSTTASQQSDIIFAYSGNQKESVNAGGNVNIHFYHALAAVQFCVGKLDDGLTVKSITVKGVKNSGYCSFVPQGICKDENGNYVTVSSKEDHYDGDVSDLFFWDLKKDSTSDYSTGELTANNTSTASQYSEFGGETVSTFFFAPQSIADLSFEMVVSNGTTERTLKHTFSGKVGLDQLNEWKAGKIYRYTISGTGVGVKVDETVNGPVDAITSKSAVKGMNNGTKVAYIRAAVVANWYNDKGQMVAPLDADKLPTINTTNKWFSASEPESSLLFYYYEDPVEPNQKTSTNLLESYIRETAGDAPKVDSHLEINIIMQAVEYDDNKAAVTKAWGSTVASNLKLKTN